MARRDGSAFAGTLPCTRSCCCCRCSCCRSACAWRRPTRRRVPSDGCCSRCWDRSDCLSSHSRRAPRCFRSGSRRPTTSPREIHISSMRRATWAASSRCLRIRSRSSRRCACRIRRASGRWATRCSSCCRSPAPPSSGAAARRRRRTIGRRLLRLNRPNRCPGRGADAGSRWRSCPRACCSPSPTTSRRTWRRSRCSGSCRCPSTCSLLSSRSAPRSVARAPLRLA